jgi:hypothetical protein
MTKKMPSSVGIEFMCPTRFRILLWFGANLTNITQIIFGGVVRDTFLTLKFRVDKYIVEIIAIGFERWTGGDQFC